MTLSKDKLIKIVILLIGLTTPILSLMNSPLAFHTRKVPISPLPLVFDQPYGTSPWIYNYKITFVNKNKIEKIDTAEKLYDERRGWLRHILFHTIMVINSPFKSEMHTRLEKSFYCDILYPVFFKDGEKVYKAIILQTNPLTKKQTTSEVICN